MKVREARPASFWPLAIFFALFVLFMYGPMFVIFILSFQGPEGGLTFPMRGVSLHWFAKLAEGLGVVDIGAALWRSLGLGVAVMLCTVVLSVLAGLAFRKRLAGGNTLFFIVVASLIMPSIIVSLGIGLEFRLIDNGIKATLEWLGMESALEGYGTSLGLFTSALGAHLTWTLPTGAHPSPSPHRKRRWRCSRPDACWSRAWSSFSSPTPPMPTSPLCAPASTTKRPPAPAATCAVPSACRATFTCTSLRQQGTRRWGASCASWSRAPRSSS